jgi:hypothetical protein
VAHRHRLHRKAIAGGEAQLQGAVVRPLHLLGGELPQRLLRGQPPAQPERQRG